MEENWWDVIGQQPFTLFIEVLQISRLRSVKFTQTFCSLQRKSNDLLQCMQRGAMATKCLRLHRPIFQFVRYASSSGGQPPPPTGRKVGQRVVRVDKAKASRPSKDDPASLGGVAVKATFEPSPIFGAVKATKKDSLKQPISNLKQQPSSLLSSKTKPGKEPAKAEKPRKPLTEDEKNVS